MNAKDPLLRFVTADPLLRAADRLQSTHEAGALQDAKLDATPSQKRARLQMAIYQIIANCVSEGSGVSYATDRAIALTEEYISELRAPKATAVRAPTREEVDSACLSYRHDCGIMFTEQTWVLRVEAKNWLRAWLKVRGGHGLLPVQVVEPDVATWEEWEQARDALIECIRDEARCSFIPRIDEECELCRGERDAGVERLDALHRSALSGCEALRNLLGAGDPLGASYQVQLAADVLAGEVPAEAIDVRTLAAHLGGLAYGIKRALSASEGTGSEVEA